MIDAQMEKKNDDSIADGAKKSSIWKITTHKARKLDENPEIGEQHQVVSDVHAAECGPSVLANLFDLRRCKDIMMYNGHISVAAKVKQMGQLSLQPS